MKRKWLARGLAACLSASLALPATAALAADRITLKDLVSAAKLMVSGAELTPEQAALYDVNSDGRLTLSDLVTLARRYTSQGPAQPTPTPAPAAPGTMLTPEGATNIALADVENSAGAQVTSCTLDTEHGTAVYEVKFRLDGTKYDYEIQAMTGDILKSSWEKQPSAASGRPVSLEEAVAQVLARIPGATAGHVVTKYDTEDGIPVFDVDVQYNGTTYEATIVRSTGELIAWSEEKQPAVTPPSESVRPDQPTASPTPAATGQPTSSATPVAVLTAEQAQQIVLDQVPEATRANITKCKFDHDDGVPVYEIEMLVGSTEYSYEVDAQSGRITKESWEKTPTAGFGGTAMDEAQAAQAAAAQVPGASASDVRTKFDTSNGVPVIEAELRYAGADYDMTFVQATGEMIEYSMDVINSGAAPTTRPSGAPATASPVPSPTPAQSSAPAGLISRNEAIAAALTRVPGADASHVVKNPLLIAEAI